MRIIKKYQVTLYSNDEKKVKQFFAYLSNFRNGHPFISMKSKYFYDIIVLYLEDNQLCNE